MKYFLDTEFHEYEILDEYSRKRPTIDLISIGIVSENGNEFYRISNEFDLHAAYKKNEWLRENVIKPIYIELASEEYKQDELNFHYWNCNDYILENKSKSPLVKCNSYIREDILEFIGDDQNPEFYAYYADYDWVVFCWLFGRMIDLPKHFPMYCIDLKQIYDEMDYPEYYLVDKKQVINKLKEHPKYPKQENLHNALADAKWNKQLWKFLMSL